MPAAFRSFLKLFLLLTLLGPLSGCADDEDDLVPPSVTLDAFVASSFEAERMISGTVAPNTSVDISVETVATADEPVIEGDRWSTTVRDLAPGFNRVQVTVQNDFNTRSLLFDLFYAIVQIDQLRTVTHDNGTTVYGRLLDTVDDADVKVFLDGDPVAGLARDTAPSPDTWSLDLTNLLNEGKNTLKIEAVDPAGETQTVTATITRNSDAVVLTIDRQEPVLADDKVTLAGKVEEGASVAASVGSVNYNAAVIYNAATVDSDWKVDITDLPEGPSLITVTASLADRPSASGEIRVEVDTLPAVVSDSLAPADMATEVSRTTTISAVFDQPVQGSSVNETTFLLDDGAVAGTVSYDAEVRKAIFTPDAPLAPSTPYTVELTAGILDAHGNPITPILPGDWTFDTAAE